MRGRVVTVAARVDLRSAKPETERRFLTGVQFQWPKGTGAA